MDRITFDEEIRDLFGETHAVKPFKCAEEIEY